MLPSFVKRLCPPPLKHRIKLACGAPDTAGCLAAMKRRGFHPNAAIDVGAYCGEWTNSLRQLFPDTRVLMIEPQSARRQRLQTLAQTHEGVEFAPVLLGPTAANKSPSTRRTREAPSCATPATPPPNPPRWR